MNTFANMKMRLYYASGRNYQRNVERLYLHCTVKRQMMIAEELRRKTFEEGIRNHMLITCDNLIMIENREYILIVKIISTSAEG